MKLALGLLLVLSGCGRSAAPAPTVDPSPRPEARPAAAPSIRGTATGVQTGVGDPDAPALEVSVSFENQGGDGCKITGYALAWDRRPDAVRQDCSAELTVDPNGTAESTCLIPFDAPMRNARPDYADLMEVVDIVATCPPSK